jgi:hypothetical protein
MSRITAESMRHVAMTLEEDAGECREDAIDMLRALAAERDLETAARPRVVVTGDGGAMTRQMIEVLIRSIPTVDVVHLPPNPIYGDEDWRRNGKRRGRRQ